MDLAKVVAKARELYPDASISAEQLSKRDLVTGKTSEDIVLAAMGSTFAFSSLDDMHEALALCIALGPARATVVASEPGQTTEIQGESPADAALDVTHHVVEPVQTPRTGRRGQPQAQTRGTIAGPAPELSI